MRGTLHIDTGGIGREILNAFEGLSADFLRSSRGPAGSERTPSDALNYLKGQVVVRLQPFMKLALKYWDVEMPNIDLTYLPNGSGEMTKRLPLIKSQEERNVLSFWFAARTISSLMNILYVNGTMMTYTNLPSRRINVDWEAAYDAVASNRLNDPFQIAACALCDLINLLGYYPLEAIVQNNVQDLVMYSVSDDYEFFGGYSPPTSPGTKDFRPKLSDYSNHLGYEADKAASQRYLKELHRFRKELASASNSPSVKIALKDVDPLGKGTTGHAPGVVRRRST